MTEDDTFNRLKRCSFEDMFELIVSELVKSGYGRISFEQYLVISRREKTAAYISSAEYFTDTGWTKEDFNEEMNKRYQEWLTNYK